MLSNQCRQATMYSYTTGLFFNRIYFLSTGYVLYKLIRIIKVAKKPKLYTYLGWNQSIFFCIFLLYSVFNDEAINHTMYSCLCLNSLVPGRSGSSFKSIIFKLIIQNNSLGTHCEIYLKWIPQKLNKNITTLVEVMAWYRQNKPWL